MRNVLIAVLLTCGLLAGCVGGTTKLRYTEMPDITGSPSSTGVLLIDSELGNPGYKPNPIDPPNATRCWIVKEGAEDNPLKVEHNYGFFVFQNLEPGRYAITQVVWNATFWIKDTRDADERSASGQTADEVPHDCRFTYTFEPFKTRDLTFVVEPGKVTYIGIMRINEPAEFEIEHGVRPVNSITRENYGHNVTVSSTASYEKRALEELQSKNANTEWNEIIQQRLNELKELGG
jgi:hypothetical protein